MTPGVVFLVAVLLGGGMVPLAYFTDRPGTPAMETCLQFKRAMSEQSSGRHRYECLPGTVEKR